MSPAASSRSRSRIDAQEVVALVLEDRQPIEVAPRRIVDRSVTQGPPRRARRRRGSSIARRSGSRSADSPRAIARRRRRGRRPRARTRRRAAPTPAHRAPRPAARAAPAHRCAPRCRPTISSSLELVLAHQLGDGVADRPRGVVARLEDALSVAHRTGHALGDLVDPIRLALHPSVANRPERHQPDDHDRHQQPPRPALDAPS